MTKQQLGNSECRAAKSSCAGCDGGGCASCPHNGAKLKKVRVIKQSKYSCPKCKYSWSAKEIGKGCNASHVDEGVAAKDSDAKGGAVVRRSVAPQPVRTTSIPAPPMPLVPPADQANEYYGDGSGIREIVVSSNPPQR